MKSRFIQAMDSLQAEASKGDLTLRRIFDLMGEEGHSVLLLFLCIPYMQPIPIPGLSTPFGLLMSLIAVFLYLQRPPWLPKRFENLRVSAKLIIKVSEVAENFWTKASRIIRERWTFFHDLHAFRLINLIVLAVNGVLLALPLPIPFSNMFPAIAVMLCAVGHTERDGLFIGFSYVWCLLSFSFFAALGLGAGWSMQLVIY